MSDSYNPSNDYGDYLHGEIRQDQIISLQDGKPRIIDALRDTTHKFQFYNAYFNGISMRNFIATRSEFLKCHFKGCDLTDMKAPYAKFYDCTFENCDFLNFYGAHADFKRCSIDSSTLAHANFRLTSFYHTAFSDRTKLAGTNLDSARLEGCAFDGAYMENAIIEGADLASSNFRFCSGIAVFGPGGSRSDYTYAVAHTKGKRVVIMVKRGCFWGELNKFVVQVNDVYGNGQRGSRWQHYTYYRGVIAAIKAWKKAYVRCENI